MKYNSIFIGIFGSLIAGLLLGCQNNSEPKTLPRLGNHIIEGSDTLYHTIPDFEFINQDSNMVTNNTFKDRLYVADFFFTSCPTICPKVKKQMLRIYNKYEEDGRVLLLSHSIDTKYDTVPRLKRYADNLGVTGDKWHFVTGSKEAIFGITEPYMSIALEDPTLPGGFDHSGWLILVDQNRHIRSFCNGTEEDAVSKFMEEIDMLLQEYN